MKLQPYIQKLEGSASYKQFQQKYKDSFLIAGFFVVDFESGQNVHQIDYYIPKEKKVAAFTLDKAVQMQLLNLMDKRVPEKLDMHATIDLDALHGIIEDEMKNRSITQTIKKMIAVLQTIEGKPVWNVNCVLSGLDLLRVHVEDKSQTVLKMERASIMEYLHKMPSNEVPQQQPPQSAKEATKEDIQKKIEQLDKLKEVLKKEEVKFEQHDAIEKEKKSQKIVKKSKK